MMFLKSMPKRAKTALLLLCAVLLLFGMLWLFVGVRLHQRPDLTGAWSARGYACDGAAEEELVAVSDEGGVVRAMKVRGDDCIRDGEDTWFAVREPDRSPSFMRGIMYARAAGAEGAAAEVPVYVEVRDPDTLVLRGENVPDITFVRQQNP